MLLTAGSQINAYPIISILSDRRACLVNEVSGEVWFMRGNGLEHYDRFTTPYQSALTGGCVDDLILHDICALPSLEDSAKVHLPFVHALLGHYRKFIDINAEVCPIT